MRIGFGYPQEGFVVRDRGKWKVASAPAAVAEVGEELAGVEPEEDCPAEGGSVRRSRYAVPAHRHFP